MTTTSDFIRTTFGVSMAQAREFIMSRVSDPAYVYSMAKQFGVTSEMLGEITGFASADVEGFFTAHGLDGIGLRAVASGAGSPLLVVNNLDIPDGIIRMNGYTGALSNESLRMAIVAQTGQAAYDAAFSPAPFDSNRDGILSPSELGTSVLGSLPATVAAMESIFFGTVVTALKALDETELANLGSFAQAHAADIEAGNAAAMEQLFSMMLTDMATPAVVPALPDSTVAEAIVWPVAEIINMVGTTADGGSLYEVLFFV